MFRATFEIAFAKAVINYICSKFYWPLYCCFFSFVFPIIPGKRKGLHKMSKTFIFSGVNISRGEYFSGVNIFQGWIFFRGEHLLGVNICSGWVLHSGTLAIHMQSFWKGRVQKKSVKKQSCAWKLWQIPEFFNTEAQGGGVGGVSVVKIIFFGKTRFKSYLTINQSQKLKLIFFHIFLTALGEGGGTVKQSWNFSKWKVVQKWKEMRKYAKKLCYSRK